MLPFETPHRDDTSELAAGVRAAVVYQLREALDGAGVPSSAVLDLALIFAALGLIPDA